MRGTPNTGAGKVTADPFAPETANDLLKIAVGADDDMLAELLALEPPAAVTAMTPRVGFLPAQNGPVVEGDAARNVKVNPLRAFRSSIDNAKPRELLSGLSMVQTTIAMPAVVTGAGNWRLELLYAQLAYIDALRAERGTQITFLFAPTAAGTNPAPSIATLPANTATTWNIPLVYVKNYTGQVGVATEDILEVPPSVSGGVLYEIQRRILGKKGVIDSRRAYSSANHDPTKMVSGGTSVFATGANLLTALVTPAVVGRHNVEAVEREILIPKELTAGTAGVLVETVIDDTRDWRGANFIGFWVLPASTTAGFFGEDDNGNGTSGTRQAPSHSDGGGTINAFHMTAGQSWENLAVTAFGAVLLVAAEVQTNTVINTPAAAMGWLAGTGNIGLTVDAVTGALKFARKITGAAAGAPIYCVLKAFFSNHRA